MNERIIIKKTHSFVKKSLSGESSGHDWWHVWRVWQTAKKLARAEKADSFVVEIGALLHDIADWKFNKNDLKASSRAAEKWLKGLKCEPSAINKISRAIEEVSFKGAGVNEKPSTKEGQVIQDADKLDAIGAIGIARCFAFGGFSGRPIYDPVIKPAFHKNFKAYSASFSPSINHFYEKLLLLEQRMNTKTARKMAASRQKFMKNYLRQFFVEWKG